MIKIKKIKKIGNRQFTNDKEINIAFDTKNEIEKVNLIKEKQRLSEDHEKKINKKINNTNKNNTKSAVILGDSMIKHIKGWDIAEKLEYCKVYVRSFGGI